MAQLLGPKLLLFLTIVVVCSGQCVTENFKEYYYSCGFYANQTISLLNNTVRVQSSPSYEISIVSNNTQCYFGLGSCSSNTFIGSKMGLGCNSPYCSFLMTVEPIYTGFTLGNMWSSTYFLPQVVNISIVTQDGRIYEYNTTKSNTNCTQSFGAGSYDFSSPIINVQLTGNYFFMDSFTFCKAAAPPPPVNPCASANLYMFGGGSKCTSLSQNQCTSCSTQFQTYYYTANCTQVGASDCVCTSYLHSGSNCGGSQLAQPIVNSTCSSLTSFYPTSGSVCLPVVTHTPSYNVVLYNSYASGGYSCSSHTQLNTCFRCVEYGTTYYFNVTCKNSNECSYTQSVYSDCSSPSSPIPIPRAGCSELYSLYGSAGQVCAFGNNYNSTDSSLLQAVTADSTQPTVNEQLPVIPIIIEEAK